MPGYVYLAYVRANYVVYVRFSHRQRALFPRKLLSRATVVLLYCQRLEPPTTETCGAKSF